MTASEVTMNEDEPFSTSKSKGFKNARGSEKDIVVTKMKISSRMKLLKFRLLLFGFCCVLYANSLDCDFVFDDVSAVKDNRDLRPHSPITNIFHHDFWGTDMGKEHSHKSYRPFTVLTFRFNYWLHQLEPMGYHALNIFLHATVCVLYHKLMSSLLNSVNFPVSHHTQKVLFGPLHFTDDVKTMQEFSPISLISTLLFAIHPIHTEAVTGIVGRAELLSSIFFILTILAYQASTLPLLGSPEQSYCIKRLCWKHIKNFLMVSIFAGCAMLCKEQGITVIGVCFVYELFVIQKLNIQEIKNCVKQMCYGSDCKKNQNFKEKTMSNNNHQQNCNNTEKVQHLSSLPMRSNDLQGRSSSQQRPLNESSYVNNSSIFSYLYDPVGQTTTFISRTLLLVVTGGLLLLLRIKIMGSTLPVFTNFDNPASYEIFPIKQLTWMYLIALNALLLIFPSDLCCDWTMKTVPLVETLADPRNMATISTFAILLHIGIVGLFQIGSNKSDSRGRQRIRTSSGQHDEGNFQIILMGLALLCLPFLPACNLFFPVGFVIAERILYIPSMGFCLLIAYGVTKICNNVSNFSTLVKTVFKVLFLVSIVAHISKTVIRNRDWKNEFSIFTSGISVTKGTNAKLLNNVGHAFEATQDYKHALRYFKHAAIAQPDDVGAHINVGRTYNNMNNYLMAEEAYIKARSLLPQPRPGQPYTARIAPQHLSVFLNLGNLVAKKGGAGIEHLEEADHLYRQAIAMRADYVQAYINRGDVLIKMGRPSDALDVYQDALKYEPENPDLHYNLGVVHIERGEPKVALEHFERALSIDPEHIQALTNSAVLMQETGSSEFRPTAYKRLFFVLNKLLPTTKEVEPHESAIAAGTDRVYFNLGMLGMDDGDTTNAEIWFKKAVELKQGFRSALFNLALLLNEQKRPLEALPYLEELLMYHSDHIKGLILLGDIYTNHVRDLAKAEECYRTIVEIDPTHVQGHHNLCVVMVEQGNLKSALQCLKDVLSLAPKEEYILRHIKIVESRLRSSEHEKQKKHT